MTQCFIKGDRNLKIIIDTTKCTKDHKCLAVQVCPVYALKQNKFDAPTINEKTCTQCGQCITACPMEALNKIRGENSDA